MGFCREGNVDVVVGCSVGVDAMFGDGCGGGVPWDGETGRSATVAISVKVLGYASLIHKSTRRYRS